MSFESLSNGVVLTSGSLDLSELEHSGGIGCKFDGGADVATVPEKGVAVAPLRWTAILVFVGLAETLGWLSFGAYNLPNDSGTPWTKGHPFYVTPTWLYTILRPMCMCYPIPNRPFSNVIQANTTNCCLPQRVARNGPYRCPPRPQPHLQLLTSCLHPLPLATTSAMTKLQSQTWRRLLLRVRRQPPPPPSCLRALGIPAHSWEMHPAESRYCEF